MKKEDSGNLSVTPVKPTDTAQVYMIVDGCKVKLNFPPKSERSAINDVKRMILCGAIRT